MNDLSKIRSTTVLFCAVALFSAMTYGMWLLAWEPPLPSTARLIFASLIFGSMFGGMAWSLLTTPATMPRSDGWRKYRFFMWWALLIAVFEGGILTKGGGFQFWGDFVPVFGISLTLTTFGWALGSLRAARTTGDIDFSKAID